MGAAGRERALAEYSWHAVAEATAEAYRDVIRAAGRPVPDDSTPA
jgi:glycosyltransferase involved in cell wall biosynthesis